MNSIWERLTSRRQNNPASTDLPIQGDRRGVQLYADFQDCLDEHKGGAFIGEDLMHRYCTMHIEPVNPCKLNKYGTGIKTLFVDLICSLIGWHALSGIAVATIPISMYKRSVAPLVIGFIFGFVPDLIYANWRCDAEYKAFKVHVADFKSRSNIDQKSNVHWLVLVFILNLIQVIFPPWTSHV